MKDITYRHVQNVSHAIVHAIYLAFLILIQILICHMQFRPTRYQPYDAKFTSTEYGLMT